jgi:hypothetical protein
MIMTTIAFYVTAIFSDMTDETSVLRDKQEKK